MEIFKYIPGIKFREVTASASIYVALGELFALGEFSRWLINIFRPLTRKLWEVLVSYLPLDIVLTIKEKDALTALLLFSPLGFVGIYYLLFSAKRNAKNYYSNDLMNSCAMLFACLFFIILLFEVIVWQELSQIDGYKFLFGVEVAQYLTPILLVMVAICGPTISRATLSPSPPIEIKLMAYGFFVVVCIVCLIFLIRFPGVIGISLFCIIIFINISLLYVPKSYVIIMIVLVLMTVTGFMVDFIKDVISQV